MTFMNIYLFPNKLNQMINIILKNLIEELQFQEHTTVLFKYLMSICKKIMILFIMEVAEKDAS
ncbi:hypothetical protein, partial [Enterococcus faecium]|uniref:hypothetical protein n=1 Tax=Enterococcus faecium TaxID=1352 RepID=UPI003CC639F4